MLDCVTTPYSVPRKCSLDKCSLDKCRYDLDRGVSGAGRQASCQAAGYATLIKPLKTVRHFPRSQRSDCSTTYAVNRNCQQRNAPTGCDKGSRLTTFSFSLYVAAIPKTSTWRTCIHISHHVHAQKWSVECRLFLPSISGC